MCSKLVTPKQGDERAPSSAIIFAANSFWNIVNFRRALINALAEEGHPVTVIAPDTHPNAALVRQIALIDVPMERSGLNPVRDGRLLWDYYRHLRRLKPAYFLSFTVKPNIYGSIAARMAGVKAVPNVSGLGTAFLKGGVLGRVVELLYRVAFRSAHAVFFQNPDDRDLFLRRALVRPEQVRLVPGSGIDLDHFSAAPLPDAPGPIFLFIGRMIGDKGVREFVEAARLLKPKHPLARFQLLGPVDAGNRTGLNLAEIERLVADGIVEYLGEAEDVRGPIRDATVVVLPSYREGLPRTLLEGAAMARPLIATDAPGCRELVDEGVTGIRCEVRNSASLANAMDRMAEAGRPGWKRMGAAARDLVAARFSQERIIDAYREVLRQPGDEAGS